MRSSSMLILYVALSSFVPCIIAAPKGFVNPMKKLEAMYAGKDLAKDFGCAPPKKTDPADRLPAEAEREGMHGQVSSHPKNKLIEDKAQHRMIKSVGVVATKGQKITLMHEIDGLMRAGQFNKCRVMTRKNPQTNKDEQDYYIFMKKIMGATLASISSTEGFKEVCSGQGKPEDVKKLYDAIKAKAEWYATQKKIGHTDIGNPKNIKIIGKSIAKFEIEFIDFGVWDDTSTEEGLKAYREWLDTHFHESTIKSACMHNDPSRQSSPVSAPGSHKSGQNSGNNSGDEGKRRRR